MNTKQTEALKLALEVLEEINTLSIGENAICLPAEIDTAMDAIREALAEQPAQQEPVAWRPIESAPKTGRKVILFYKNRLNVGRTVIARCLTDEQATEIDADDVGLEGGWYECIDNWGDFTDVVIHEGEPSHWMPLPAPPIEALRQALETEREWVGLTDEEINSVRHKRDWTASWTDTTFARSIEAKLKEKNHG